MDGTSETGFESLYATHQDAMRAYMARRLDASRVDDAVADTFAVAWKKIDQMPNGDASLPWLYGVAWRVVAHQWRRKITRMMSRSCTRRTG